MITLLNPELLKSQKVTEKQQEELLKIYDKLYRVLNRPLMFDNPVLEVEVLEYLLQENWNFTKNSDYHSYWYKLDGCTCPRLDNQDMFGTKYRLYNEHCPFHG